MVWEWRGGVMGAGIQLTGTSFQYHLEGDYPVCRNKRGRGRREEQMRKRSREINRSKVTDKRIRICFRFKQRKKKQTEEGQNEFNTLLGRTFVAAVVFKRLIHLNIGQKKK